jgi:putative protease
LEHSKTSCEILAPAGGSEQLLAAVRCGANAVYLGAKNFNARRNAENFGETDLRQAVSYCHARNVKVYVTVNTLVLDSELGALEEEADWIAEAGADAVIIQDMAVLRLFAGRYPTIKRHASTQTAVHNIDGAKFLEDAGFDSIVLARELSLDEMESICSAVNVPAEAFVHGAHCMSVSGACTLSAMLGGRSGNRGLCAQPCRLDWTCGEKRYALSLKDMSLISHLSEMAYIGVRSFKIEGRMKRPEYVAAAVTACRQSLTGEPFNEELLRAAFSRSGFTDGYLTGKRTEEMFGYRTKDDVTDMGNALKPLAALYKDETPLVPVDLSFTLDARSARLSVSDGDFETFAESDAPEPAIRRPLDEASARQNLVKTGGTPFYVCSFTAEIAVGYALSAAALNALRREALDRLLETRSQIQPHTRQPFEWEPSPRRVTPPEHPPLWARFYEEAQIDSAEAFEKIILPAEQITAETIHRYPGKLIAQLPTLLFPQDEPTFNQLLDALVKGGLTEVWTNNIYGIELGRRLGLIVHGGFGLNVLNTQALLFYETQRLSSLTVSFELAMAKIKPLGGAIPRGVVSYGRVPLMHLRNCPVRAVIGCKACKKEGVLTDRMQIAFPVECEEMRSSALLNSVPIDLAGRNLTGLDYQLLYFTRENADEIKSIAARFLAGEKTDQPHTGGLYYRELL